VTRSFWAGPVVALLSGLVLLTAGAAGWVSGVDTRDVGGVVLREPTATSGTVFAPLAVAFGLAGLLGGAVLGFVRARPRRILGAVVALAGIGAVAVVAAGVVTASRADGQLTPAPFLALAAAVGLAVGGGAAVSGVRRPPQASRYRVPDERSEDDEWSLAAREDDSGS
jgi:hypothetical protein